MGLTACYFFRHFCYKRFAQQEFYTDDPKTCPDYGRIINQRHFRRIMAMLADSTVAVGGDNDESDCYIGKKQKKHFYFSQHIQVKL